MNIVETTKTIRVFSFQLSEEQVRDLLIDPELFQDHLRAALNGASPDIRVPCTFCGRKIQPSRLALHLLRKHPPTMNPSNGDQEPLHNPSTA